MTERKALVVAFDNSDKRFFQDHPLRRAHIRQPFKDECHAEFWSLGDHNRTRRRILLWKVPRDNPFWQKMKEPILKIPFLLYSDETVEDRDEILLPIIDEIMQNAAGG